MAIIQLVIVNSNKTMKPTSLLVARHASTMWNEREKLIGRQEAELSMTGLIQAERLARVLSNEKIDLIYTSGLGRAIDTGKIVAKYHRLRVLIDPALDERGWGVFEGKNRKEIAKDLRRLEKSAEKISGTESSFEFESRVIAFLEKCLRNNEGKTILIVSHEGPVKVMQNYFMRFDTTKHDDDFHASLAGISEFLVKKLEPLEVAIKRWDQVDYLK
jgi:broad specificity phosphatase PhoE